MKQLEKIVLVIIVSSSLLLMSGCKKERYEVQYFTFPQGTSVTQVGWKYKGSITVSSNEKGSMFRLGNKVVTLLIVDENNKVLLKDVFYYKAASIRAIIKWSNRENLTIELIERGNSDVDDAYSKLLAKEGDRSLEKFKYKEIGGNFVLQSRNP